MILLFCIGSQVPAQEAVDVQRAPQSIAVLERSLAALGVTTQSTISTFRAAGMQVSKWNNSTPRQASFKWLFAGGEFRTELSDGESLHRIVSNHGAPKISGKFAGKLPYHMIRAMGPFVTPAMELQLLINTPKVSIYASNSEVLNGVPVIRVATCECGDTIGRQVTPQEWLFDASTYLPLQVTLRVPTAGDASETYRALLTFKGFTQVDQFVTPLQIHYEQEGGLSRDFTIITAHFNGNFAASEFEIDGEGE